MFGDLIKQIYKKAARNVGALEMMTDPSIRSPVIEYNVQYLPAPPTATWGVDKDRVFHAIFTDGIHLSLPLRVPDGCTSRAYPSVLDQLGGYRVTPAGQAWFSTQGMSLPSAGEYLTDAQAAASELDAWVEKGYVDTYTSPIHFVTCNSLLELQRLGISNSFIMAQALSDKERKALPGSALSYMTKTAPPFVKQKGYFDRPDFFSPESLAHPVFGGKFGFVRRGLGYPETYGRTLYRLDDGEFVHAPPTDGRAYRSYTVLG